MGTASAAGRTPARRLSFTAIREVVGFDAYDRLLDRYRTDDAGP